LKSSGCFSKWYINPYKSEANGVFIFENVDLNILSQLIQTKNNQLKKNEKMFWFDEKIFNIKIIDGSIRQVDFSPKKNENHTPDPFYLLKVLISILKTGFEPNQSIATTKINRNELIKKIKVDYPSFNPYMFSYPMPKRKRETLSELPKIPKNKKFQWFIKNPLAEVIDYKKLKRLQNDKGPW